MANPRSRLVLIVEDDPPTAEVLATAIGEERGYATLRVGTAQEALVAMGALAPDLVLLDIRLPGMSGLELYDRIKRDARYRSIPVIIETGGHDHADELRDRGIATYVRKPFDVDQVVRFVKRLVPPPNASAHHPIN